MIKAPLAVCCWACSGSGPPAAIPPPMAGAWGQRLRSHTPFRPLAFWTGNDLARSAALGLTSMTQLSTCNVLIYSKCYFPGSFYSLSLPHPVEKIIWNLVMGLFFITSTLQLMKLLLLFIYKSIKKRERAGRMCWGVWFVCCRGLCTNPQLRNNQKGVNLCFPAGREVPGEGLCWNLEQGLWKISVFLQNEKNKGKAPDEEEMVAVWLLRLGLCPQPG